jgi:hypothetical protein
LPPVAGSSKSGAGLSSILLRVLGLPCFFEHGERIHPLAQATE